MDRGGRVEIDAERCQGHDRCRRLAPELFEVDDHGFARVVGDGTVPPSLVGRALAAVRNCPEGAVTFRPVEG